jgi:hypothetical protein
MLKSEGLSVLNMAFASENKGRLSRRVFFFRFVAFVLKTLSIFRFENAVAVGAASITTGDLLLLFAREPVVLTKRVDGSGDWLGALARPAATLCTADSPGTMAPSEPDPVDREAHLVGPSSSHRSQRCVRESS